MNSTTSATSIVYAGCVDGSLLLPYVVYKATNMCDTRTLGPIRREVQSQQIWLV